MKYIELTRGQRAKVDDADYEELNKHKWYALWRPGGHSFYAARNRPLVNGKQGIILMARAIMGAQSGQVVDHINHDTLDNRRENLRVCTQTENMQNRKLQGGTSRYKGVSWHRKHWVARIGTKRRHIGYFASEIEAAHAYDKAARTIYGRFALCNFADE